jgi:DNA (cytosine-5)-methyltransferase 1
VYANDIDIYCKQIYDKNFSNKCEVQTEQTDVRNLPIVNKHDVEKPLSHYDYQRDGLDTRSITDVSAGEIPDADLLCGGFPCQSFSIAGKRKGFNDTRGTLFFDIARIVKEKRPRYLLLENVKGLLSHDKGRTFKIILSTLTELHYDLQTMVLNSKNFGVPQNRERVFIIGHLRGTPRPQVFPITENNESDIVLPTLTARHYGAQANGSYIRQEQAKIGTYRTHKDGQGFREMKSGLSPTIPARAREDGSGQPVVALTERRNKKAKQIRREMLKQGRDWSPRREKELVARTDGRIGTLTAARNFDTMLLDNTKFRRLTPIECERLQGFPDNWTEGVSDTQRYKMMGNAVTVNVVYEIAKLLT